jgi:cytochrome c biogenesis protein CcdA
MKLKSAKLTILLLVAAVFILAFLFYADVGSAQAQEEACKTGLQSLNLTTWAVACGAAVDAVNPCEFAILILLMASMLIEEENRKKALFTGLSFIGAVFVAYFLMGIGLLETIRATTLALSSYFYKIVGILAIIFGLLNIKDYFWYGGGGFLMEVPPRWRPKMKEFIRKATTPWGGFAIGLLISLFLLPCTSGPYVVILSMLAAKTTFFKAFVYLIFYNLIFITPMAAIVLAMYFGLPPEKAENWRKNKIRLLHLVAGVILLALGAVILFGLI